MEAPLKGRYVSDVEELDYYEINLPQYLQLSLDRWKYDTRITLVDCFYDDLLGSINSAEADDEITIKHAQYLRSRFLGL